MDSANQPPLSPVTILYRMITGFSTSQMIFVAAKLGVADYLAQGLHTTTDLAKVTGTDAATLYRFLRALATLGVLEEGDAQTFALTEVGAYLQTQTPDSLYDLVRWTEEVEWELWRNLEQSVRTGQSAFDQVHGLGMFDYFNHNPDQAALFNRAMTSFVSRNVAGIVAAYRFAPGQTIIDVGGGLGSLMAAILQANPGTVGVVYDQPSVVNSPGKALESANLLDRGKYVGGNFFTAVPAGGDVYLLVSILHDWDDERCITILKNCRLAMTKQAKLLIAETVVPPGPEASFAKLLDIDMLVLTSGGRERTAAEFEKLLIAASFHLTCVIPTDSTVSVIEAIPV